MTPSAQTAGGRRVTRWTRELIIEKILEWDARYGEPPSSADWNPSLARWRAQEWRAERYREGVWPSTNAAKRPFGGSFDAAVRAAGLEPHRPGPRRRAPVAPEPPVDQREPLDCDVAERASRLAGEAEFRVAELERALIVAEARAETAAAERRARELSALVATGQRRLTGGELSELRDGGPSGPAVLASALRRLAKARATGDRGGLASALAEVASAAVRWRDRI
jgi:hypothetical protein